MSYTKQLKCGCVIRRRDTITDYWVDYCLLHKAAPELCEWLRELPLHCGCVYLDEDNPLEPAFTIDTDYLELRKKILAKAEGDK